MKHLKKTVFILLLLLTAIGSNAQIEKHAFWTYSTEKISDSELYIVFTVKIDPGWHLYAPSNPPGGSLPLSIEIAQSPYYQAEGDIIEAETPKKVFDEIFQKDEYFYEHKAIFKQKIKVLKNIDFEVKGTIDGQVCYENGRCINFTEDFSIPVKGSEYKAVSASVPTQNLTEQEKQASSIKEIKPIEVAQLDTVQASEKQDTGIAVIKQGAPKDTVTKVSLKPTGYTPILVSNNPWSGVEGKKSLGWFFWISFLLGLAALLTPCVFPMVPMTVAFFIKGKDKIRGRINAMIYGLSIVLIYTVPIAILVGITNVLGGENLSADFANWLSTHWLPNILFFIIFLIFAASFFGAFELTLPYKWVNKVNKKSEQGGIVGIFFLAFTLVLVSFSCTGPIVGGILVESTQGGMIMKPIVGMLGFSLGVALPFTLFALFPEFLNTLPKSGGWLNSVKVVLGFLELALGLKFLSVADQTYHWGLLNREVYLALWIVIFSLMGLYLMGKIKFAHDTEVKHIGVIRLFFIIITFSFVVWMIPGLWGAPLRALSGYLPPKTTQEFDIERMTMGESSVGLCDKPMYSDQLELPHNLKGYFDVYQALNCAKKQKKPIFVDFTGHGCVNCRKMEEYVWSDPRVLRMLQNDYIILSLYVDDKVIETPKNRWFVSLADGKLKKMLGKQNADIQIVNFEKNSQPYYVLIDWQGNVLARPMEYDTDVNNFIKFLETGKTNFKKLHPF